MLDSGCLFDASSFIFPRSRIITLTQLTLTQLTPTQLTPTQLTLTHSLTPTPTLTLTLTHTQLTQLTLTLTLTQDLVTSVKRLHISHLIYIHIRVR